jgi:protease IV
METCGRFSFGVSVRATIMDMQRSFAREVALIITKAFVVIGSIILIIVGVFAFVDADLGVSDGTCNIAVLPVEGEIWPYRDLAYSPFVVTPDMIESFMDTAESDSAIQAVLVEVNSPGGTPVAAERIAERIHSSTLPTVGMIGDMGASGGYMVAAATDYLIASPMSMVGSIGVTMSYLENSKKNEEEGIEFVELATGKYKNAGSPDKPLTEEERALFERDLGEIHDEFVSMVSKYRDLPVDKVKGLADGSTLGGRRAMEAGLVDGTGARKEAKQALAKILEKPEDEIIFCEYESSLIPF